MTRKIFFIVFACSFILGVSVLSFAQGGDSPAVQENKVVNVGNKICPVLGEKIDEETKATYEYKGKIYNFCCSMCVDEFKKDPEKYIQKVEQELRTESESQTKQEEHAMDLMPGSGTSNQGMHGGHHH
jgi:YHS domain-containing protein